MKSAILTKLLLFVVMAGFLTGCPASQVADTTSKNLDPAAAERHDVLYACSCGKQCQCGTASTKPGKCGCGRPLKWGHALKVEGETAILCQCPEGCRCYAQSSNISRCTCGVETVRVSLEGSPVYFCRCGSACFCNYFSDSPGNCKCGNRLTRAY